MFSLGEAYDAFMGRWSAHLAPLLVQFANVTDRDDVLDVGSGTGALTAAVATVAQSCCIVGIDRSEPYVSVARARHRSERVRFVVGDAQYLPFQDTSFDRTLSLLFLNFVPDQQKALTEMTRVTRPGGTVAAAVWDYGEGMEMLRAFWDEAIAVNPGAATKDERHMPLSRSGELAELWRTGLESVSETALTIETHFSSFEDYWSPFLQRQGPAGAHVGTLSPEECKWLKSRLRERLSSNDPHRPFTLHARAWAVRGTVGSHGSPPL